MISDHDGMASCVWCGRRFPHDDGDGYCERCARLKANGHTYAELSDREAAMREDMEKMERDE